MTILPTYLNIEWLLCVILDSNQESIDYTSTELTNKQWHKREFSYLHSTNRNQSIWRRAGPLLFFICPSKAVYPTRRSFISLKMKLIHFHYSQSKTIFSAFLKVQMSAKLTTLIILSSWIKILPKSHNITDGTIHSHLI